MLIVKI